MRLAVAFALSVALLAAGQSDAAVRNGRLAFAGPQNELVVAGPDGSHKRVLFDSGRYGDARCRYPCSLTDLAWSPDGTRIAFLQGDLGAGPGCVSNCRLPRIWLNTIDVRTGFRRRLAECGGCGHGIAWSPDSSRIAVTTNGGLLAVDARTGAAHQLAVLGEAPAWAPDGKTVAFVAGTTIFRVNALGRPRLRALATLEGADNPSWAPDSRSLLFDGQDSIYRVSVDGSGLRSILRGGLGTGPSHPVFSPDGKQVLYFFTPGSPGKFVAELWLMRPDGSHKTRVFQSRCCVGIWERPIWSPDGTRVIISADSAGGTIVMDVHGGHRHRLSQYATPVSWQSIR